MGCSNMLFNTDEILAELNAKAELKGISSTVDPKQKAIHDTVSKT